MHRDHIEEHILLVGEVLHSLNGHSAEEVLHTLGTAPVVVRYKHLAGEIQVLPAQYSAGVLQPSRPFHS